MTIVTPSPSPAAAPLARREMRVAAIAALSAIPGVNVKSPGVWATQPSNTPEILVDCGIEQKASLGRTVPEYTTSCVLQVSARLISGTAESALDAIEALGATIEAVLLGNVAFIARLQQVSEVVSKTTLDSSAGHHTASLVMALTCEHVEVYSPDEIDPTQFPDISELLVHVDLTNIADRSGTYADPAFPSIVVPAPRTHGPDGREEATARATFPTT